MTKLNPNDNRQTLISGYLSPTPPDTMGPRAAARYSAMSTMDRYRCFLLPGHVDLADAVAYARREKIAGEFNIEHQVAPDSKSQPLTERRWRIDGAGAVDQVAIDTVPLQ